MHFPLSAPAAAGKPQDYYRLDAPDKAITTDHFNHWDYGHIDQTRRVRNSYFAALEDYVLLAGGLQPLIHPGGCIEFEPAPPEYVEWMLRVHATYLRYWRVQHSLFVLSV